MKLFHVLVPIINSKFVESKQCFVVKVQDIGFLLVWLTFSEYNIIPSNIQIGTKNPNSTQQEHENTTSTEINCINDKPGFHLMFWDRIKCFQYSKSLCVVMDLKIFLI